MIRSIKVVSLVVPALVLATTGVAIAGGGGHNCRDGYALETAESPVLANEANSPVVDPKWLALQKRLELEVQSADGDVVVPN